MTRRLRAAVLAVVASGCVGTTIHYVHDLMRRVADNEIAMHAELRRRTITVRGMVRHSGILDGADVGTRSTTRVGFRQLITDTHSVYSKPMPYLALSDTAAGPFVICIFQPDKAREAAGAVDRGDAVVRGRVVSVHRDMIVMERCRVQ